MDDLTPLVVAPLVLLAALFLGGGVLDVVAIRRRRLRILAWAALALKTVVPLIAAVWLWSLGDVQTDEAIPQFGLLVSSFPVSFCLDIVLAVALLVTGRDIKGLGQGPEGGARRG